MTFDIRTFKQYSSKKEDEKHIINIEQIQNKQEPTKKEELSDLVKDINEKEFKKSILVDRLINIIKKHYKNVDYLDTL